ncbi:hypothetical protein FKM82_015526 [Ascaphus truei]
MGIRRVQLSIYSVRKNMYTGILSFRALAFFNHKLLLIEQGWGNSRSGFQDIPASAQGVKSVAQSLMEPPVLKPGQS